MVLKFSNSQALGSYICQIFHNSHFLQSSDPELDVLLPCFPNVFDKPCLLFLTPRPILFLVCFGLLVFKLHVHLEVYLLDLESSILDFLNLGQGFLVFHGKLNVNYFSSSLE